LGHLRIFIRNAILRHETAGPVVFGFQPTASVQVQSSSSSKAVVLILKYFCRSLISSSYRHRGGEEDPCRASLGNGLAPSRLCDKVCQGEAVGTHCNARAASACGSPRLLDLESVRGFRNRGPGAARDQSLSRKPPHLLWMAKCCPGRGRVSSK